MRLQDKKVISFDFQLQRKMQIDEGVKIAQKVDKLRELLVSLEAQQAKFLAGSQQEIINATRDLQLKKDLIQGEVRQLEERRKELLRPLEDEWIELTKEQSKFQIDLLELENREHNLNERESTIKKIEKTIEQERQQISGLKRDAEVAYTETIENQRISKESRKQTETDRDLQNKEFAKTNKELTKKNEELIVQRKYLDLVKANLEDREKGLNNKERAIADKYATLQRTVNRLKK